MAKFSASIDTKATGPLSLSFDMSEERAQDIFAFAIGSSAPVTQEDGTKRQIKLGEALTNMIRIFITDIEIKAITYKRAEAGKAAMDAIIDTPEIILEPVK